MSGDRRSPKGPSDGAGLVGWLRWFARTDHAAVSFVRDAASSVLLVALVGAVLFAASGVWPPMVAVESGSMEPHMSRGDLVFVMEEHRLAPGIAVAGTGVVSHQAARKAGRYRKFGAYGDVIVFDAPSRNGPPIIHRARFYVEEGENWYDRANESYVRADSCSELEYCPAPHAGFITKGDNSASNPHYDQASGLGPPVRPSWIHGTAEVRIPLLGHVRLVFDELGARALAALASG